MDIDNSVWAAGRRGMGPYVASGSVADHGLFNPDRRGTPFLPI